LPGCIHVGKSKPDSLCDPSVCIGSTDKIIRSLPSNDLSTVSALSSTYSSVLNHVELVDPKRTAYSEFFESLLEQVLARRNQHRDQDATSPINHGVPMDWMESNFEQAVLDASCSFDLANIDNFMLDYPYLIDHDQNVGW